MDGPTLIYGLLSAPGSVGWAERRVMNWRIIQVADPSTEMEEFIKSTEQSQLREGGILSGCTTTIVHHTYLCAIVKS